jgi:hypothetical protein
MENTKSKKRSRLHYSHSRASTSTAAAVTRLQQQHPVVPVLECDKSALPKATIETAPPAARPTTTSGGEHEPPSRGSSQAATVIPTKGSIHPTVVTHSQGQSSVVPKASLKSDTPALPHSVQAPSNIEIVPEVVSRPATTCGTGTTPPPSSGMVAPPAPSTHGRPPGTSGSHRYINGDFDLASGKDTGPRKSSSTLPMPLL